mgnify:CR=1 FL=1
MLTKEQIMEIIPHRPPMLLVDTITEQSDNGAKGELHLSGEEFFFQGHFPGAPIMPAVFQLEALAQVGAVALPHGSSGRDAVHGDRAGQAARPACDCTGQDFRKRRTGFRSRN